VRHELLERNEEKLAPDALKGNGSD
jgi:hypothetical protein